MQKRKFDELISHFNRKVADMSIDQKYKMELLGMISAIGFAHEKELSTNLAEVGTDCISRQAAIEAFGLSEKTRKYGGDHSGYDTRMLYEIQDVLEGLPSAEPKIIYCKDCRKHNKRIGDYVEKSDGTYDWIWKDQACPLAEFRGVAQGHEFDYQFCAYAERREE